MDTLPFLWNTLLFQKKSCKIELFSKAASEKADGQEEENSKDLIYGAFKRIKKPD